MSHTIHDPFVRISEIIPLLRSKAPEDRQQLEARLAVTPLQDAQNLLGTISTKQQETTLARSLRSVPSVPFVLSLCMLLYLCLNLLTIVEGQSSGLPLLACLPMIWSFFQAEKYRGTEGAVFFLAALNDPRAVILLLNTWRRHPKTDPDRWHNQRIDLELIRLLDELADVHYVSTPTWELTRWLRRRFFSTRKNTSQDLTEDEAYLLSAAMRFLQRHGNITDTHFLQQLTEMKSRLPNRALVQEVATSVLNEIKTPKRQQASAPQIISMHRP